MFELAVVGVAIFIALALFVQKSSKGDGAQVAPSSVESSGKKHTLPAQTMLSPVEVT